MWRLVENTPPLVIALVFFTAFLLSLVVMRRAPRGDAMVMSHAPAERVTQQQVRADGGSVVNQTAQGNIIGTQHVYNSPTPRRFPEFDDGVPHLMWSGVEVVLLSPQGYELRVKCANVGRRIAHVTPGSRVSATARMPHLEGNEAEAIRFVDFSVPGWIEPVSGPGPFTLRMRCDRASALPEREVVWRVVYTDDDGVALGFVTECSATLTSYLGRWSVSKQPAQALDNSSRAERHESYKRLMASRTGGTGSTGPRRMDWQ